MGYTTLISSLSGGTAASMADGSSAAPGLHFTGTSSATGFYLVATNSLGFSANGTSVGSYSSAGQWTFGSSGGAQNHVMNGRSLTITHAAASSAYLQIINTSTGNAILDLAAQGAGDTFAYFNGTGIGTAWYGGVDNSNSDVFCIGPGAAPGASDYFSISTAGLLTLGATGGSQRHRINGGAATAASQVLTLTNGPSGTSGNPGLWIQVNYNGTNYVIPAWAGA